MGLFHTEVRIAVFSPDRKYRYRLTTIWDASKLQLVGLFCNPSIADERREDNTDRLFRARAKELGYGGTVMINMFAFVSTAPAAMLLADNPTGPDNDRHILDVCKIHRDVFCGWGLNGAHKGRAEHVIKKIRTQLGNYNVFYYLKLTKDGHPAHPLYIKKTTPFTVWEGFS